MNIDEQIARLERILIKESAPISDAAAQAAKDRLGPGRAKSIQAIVGGIVPVLREYFAEHLLPVLKELKEVHALKQRIGDLENKTANFKYVGVFKQGNAYTLGN